MDHSIKLAAVELLQGSNINIAAMSDDEVAAACIAWAPRTKREIRVKAELVDGEVRHSGFCNAPNGHWAGPVFGTTLLEAVSGAIKDCLEYEAKQRAKKKAS